MIKRILIRGLLSWLYILVMYYLIYCTVVTDGLMQCILALYAGMFYNELYNTIFYPVKSEN